MSINLTIFVCIILYIIVGSLFCADTIRIFRDLKKQKLLKTEVAFVLFFTLLTCGFGVFGYIHFHEKDWRESLKEFKKFSLYRNFFVSHTMMMAFVLALDPSMVWLSFNSYIFLPLAFCVFLVFSLFFAFLSYLVQLPNFFDRHTIITIDEKHRRKSHS